MALSDLVAAIARRSPDEATEEVVDVITFIESPWGLDLKLFPVQRVILKAHYGMALDDNPLKFPLDVPVPPTHPGYSSDLVDEDGFYKYRILITDFRRENPRAFTEAGYLAFLHADGRCNIKEVIPGVQRREMVLSIGRRSGKTLITSCIIAYENYKLLHKGNAQAHYGVSQSNTIQLISVATDKDQAALMYQEASGHFQKCDFFRPYAANTTQSFATFQTPYDIEAYGPYKDNPKARFSVRVTFRSCVAKGLRGGNNILVALDEVAHFGDRGQGSAEEIYQAVEPSTRTFSPKDPKNKTRPIGENEGRIILISSPLGKQGLFYKQFRLGFGNHAAAQNLLCVEAPTWEVNPTVPAATFVGSYLKDPTVFDTEFGAKFTDRTRGWLENKADLLACIDPNLRPKFKASPRVPHFIGLDIALVGDGTAIAVGHIDQDKKVVLDYIDQIKAGEGDYFGLERLDFEEIADWVLSISKKFYIAEGIFDQFYGIAMEQALHKRGLKQMKSLSFTRQLSSDVYQNFKNQMYDKKLLLFDWPIAPNEAHSAHIQELTELQAEHISKYVIKVEAPKLEGKHDDLSDALVRMVWVATQSIAKKGIVLGTSSNRVGSLAMSSRFAVAPGRSSRIVGGSAPSRQIIKPRGF